MSACRGCHVRSIVRPPAPLRETMQYARAGVKYVLAQANFNSNPAFDVLTDGGYPYRLAAGQPVEISVDKEPAAQSSVSAVSLLVGTEKKTSRDHLKVTFCSGNTACSEGLVEVQGTGESRPLYIQLDRSVRIDAGKGYAIRIEKLDGNAEVALWMYPLASAGTEVKLKGTPAAVRSEPSRT